MGAEPWSKFFWSDYDADEGLRMCSLAAQGLWMRMLCLMARATPKGELRVGGSPCTVSDLSRVVGETDETVTSLLGELQRRGVFSTTRAGVIFSRRIRNDAELSRKRAKAGAEGARVRYGKETDNGFCNSKPQASDLAKGSPQKPEATSSVSNDTGGEPPIDPAKMLFDAGIALLTTTGTPEKQARALLGKWRRDAGDDEVRLAVAEAQIARVSDPVPWMAKRLQAKPSRQAYGATPSYVEHLRQQKRQEAEWAANRRASA